MKLSNIARKILSEDMGAPVAQQQATVSTPVDEKEYDALHDFQNFESILDKQVEAAKKNLESTLSKNLLNKNVTARASKGAVGQIEKDYTFVVNGIAINYMNDEYYIVLKDKNKKDYYINPAFKMKVAVADPSAEEPTSSDSPQASPVQPPEDKTAGGFKNVGGIKYPQNMGIGSNKNTVSNS